MSVLNNFKIRKANLKWRRNNAHNSTYMRNNFDISRVKVGNCTYGGLYILMHNHYRHVSIGHFCSIAPEVSFIVESEHPINLLSTFPFKNKCLKMGWEAISKGNITVEDDVWIGYRATILSGVHIGQGAVVAAGSVVSSDVPPYAVVGGLPAKIIKYRFDEQIRAELLNVDYSKLSPEIIRENINLLYKEVNLQSINTILQGITREQGI